MKKLLIVLTGVFVIGGTSALAIANSGNAENNLNQANTNPTVEGSSGKTQISKDDAAAVATNMLDGRVKEIELDREDGNLMYEVEIEFKGNDYDFDIDALTGEVIKIDDDLSKTPLAKDVSVSEDEAIDTVKEQFSNGKVDDVKLEMKKARLVYEIEVEVNDDDGDVHVDAETGELIYVESDLKNSSAKETVKSNDSEKPDDEKSSQNTAATAASALEKISSKKAEEIALNHIGEGHIDEIELEQEDGKLLYQVEIENGDDTEVYIDAYTGEVLYVDYD